MHLLLLFTDTEKESGTPTLASEDKEAVATNKAMNLAAKWIQLQAQFALRLQQQQQLEADEVAAAVAASDKIGKNNNQQSQSQPQQQPLSPHPRFPLDLTTLSSSHRSTLNAPSSFSTNNPSNSIVSFASLMMDTWPGSNAAVAASNNMTALQKISQLTQQRTPFTPQSPRQPPISSSLMFPSTSLPPHHAAGIKPPFPWQARYANFICTVPRK